MEVADPSLEQRVCDSFVKLKRHGDTVPGLNKTIAYPYAAVIGAIGVELGELEVIRKMLLEWKAARTEDIDHDRISTAIDTLGITPIESVSFIPINARSF